MTKMRLLLTLSIVFNIFLAGTIAGALVWRNFGHGMIFAGSLRVAGAELPAQQQRAFRIALRQARGEAMETIAKSREAKARAASLLRQADVDEAALFAALEEARTADISTRAAIEKKAAEFALGLSAQDRVRLAEAIDERIQRAMDRPR